MMKWLWRHIGVALSLSLGLAAPATAGDHHVIVCGAGGEAAYSERFQAWAGRLESALLFNCGVDAEAVHLLCPAEESPEAKATLRLLIESLSTELGAEDGLYLYFIGHGSAQRNEVKFVLPGPDLEAVELLSYLQGTSAFRVVLINGISSSAGFINALSGGARTIVTSTNSVEQWNATEYMEFFIQALEGDGGDQDRDDQITVLEAAEFAATATLAWYEEQGLIPTEHALLDDNGDGLGTRLPREIEGVDPEKLDGEIAGTLLLRQRIYGAGVPPETIDAYQAAVAAVESFRTQKPALAEVEYYRQLEARLIEAARLGSTIRRSQE